MNFCFYTTKHWKNPCIFLGFFHCLTWPFFFWEYFYTIIRTLYNPTVTKLNNPNNANHIKQTITKKWNCLTLIINMVGRGGTAPTKNDLKIYLPQLNKRKTISSPVIKPTCFEYPFCNYFAVFQALTCPGPHLSEGVTAIMNEQ